MKAGGFAEAQIAFAPKQAGYGLSGVQLGGKDRMATLPVPEDVVAAVAGCTIEVAYALRHSRDGLDPLGGRAGYGVTRVFPDSRMDEAHPAPPCDVTSSGV